MNIGNLPIINHHGKKFLLLDSVSMLESKNIIEAILRKRELNLSGIIIITSMSYSHIDRRIRIQSNSMDKINAYRIWF
jgi:hypothetical protein